MSRAFLKKFTALLLLFAIFAGSALCLCRDVQAAGAFSQSACAASVDAATDQCPDCPGDSHSETGPCASSCDCPCQPTLIEPSLQLGHSPLVCDLVSAERFTAFPEVYLPKFVPPQNLA